ncbi:hypothetical protein BX661DRAFT_187026, partial [Kickxella alabastrina]|uniref:uncharacterized protein n=1 Tax=Kickxella alabastrina TaxID=61397 RepID=UPI002220FEEA
QPNSNTLMLPSSGGSMQQQWDRWRWPRTHLQGRRFSWEFPCSAAAPSGESLTTWRVFSMSLWMQCVQLVLIGMTFRASNSWTLHPSPSQGGV